MGKIMEHIYDDESATESAYLSLMGGLKRV